MSEITGDMIRTAKRMLDQKKILPLKIRGHEFYIFPVGGDCRVLELGIARKNWYDYYRAQRVLRNLRRRNKEQCSRFGKVFYDGVFIDDLRQEYQDGRYGMDRVPISTRLLWYKLRNKR